jgi:predicted CDP-diglyceride synthetase/phosphatidate cytidylyltransferase
MTLTVALTILICASLAFLASWRIAARPADPLKPRLLSWNVMMILSFFIMVLMIIHIVNLAGIKTGRF